MSEYYHNYVLLSSLVSLLVTFFYMAYTKESLFDTVLVSICCGIFGIIVLPFVLVYFIFAIPHLLIGKLGDKSGKH